MSFSDLLPHIPEHYKKGYLKVQLLSVTVEINRQIGKLKKQGKKPALIRMDRVFSMRFTYEQNQGKVFSPRPKKYLGIPIEYNCKDIIGVMVLSRSPP